MPRARHQATVAQPVQQGVQARQAVQDPKLLADALLQVFRPSHTRLRIGGLLIEIGLQLLFLGVGQFPAVAAPPPLGQPFHPLGVVAIDPNLHDPSRDAEDLADLRGGMALLGQNDHLQPQQQPGVSLLAHQRLQLLQRIMFLDMHERSSLIRPTCHTRRKSATLTAPNSAIFKWRRYDPILRLYDLTPTITVFGISTNRRKLSALALFVRFCTPVPSGFML